MRLKSATGCFTVLLWLVSGLAAPAHAKQAYCLIKSDGEIQYKGTCQFSAERNGSFYLSAGKSGKFIPGISIISVTIISRGTADVRGLTAGGINSRYGTARRSRRDGACWVGTDFRICAW